MTENTQVVQTLFNSATHFVGKSLLVRLQLGSPILTLPYARPGKRKVKPLKASGVNNPKGQQKRRCTRPIARRATSGENTAQSETVERQPQRFSEPHAHKADSATSYLSACAVYVISEEFTITVPSTSWVKACL